MRLKGYVVKRKLFNKHLKRLTESQPITKDSTPLQVQQINQSRNFMKGVYDSMRQYQNEAAGV